MISERFKKPADIFNQFTEIIIESGSLKPVARGRYMIFEHSPDGFLKHPGPNTKAICYQFLYDACEQAVQKEDKDKSKENIDDNVVEHDEKGMIIIFNIHQLPSCEGGERA